MGRPLLRVARQAGALTPFPSRAGRPRAQVCAFFSKEVVDPYSLHGKTEGRSREASVASADPPPSLAHTGAPLGAKKKPLGVLGRFTFRKGDAAQSAAAEQAASERVAGERAAAVERAMADPWSVSERQVATMPPGPCDPWSSAGTRRLALSSTGAALFQTPPAAAPPRFEGQLSAGSQAAALFQTVPGSTPPPIAGELSVGSRAAALFAEGTPQVVPRCDMTAAAQPSNEIWDPAVAPTSANLRASSAADMASALFDEMLG